MRVPTRSDGTRSGVNWIRRNWPPSTSLTALIVIVFARPGTPSSRMWPSASSATNTRSSICSWPTITRLTSNKAVSKVWRTSSGPPTAWSRLCSLSTCSPLVSSRWDALPPGWYEGFVPGAPPLSLVAVGSALRRFRRWTRSIDPRPQISVTGLECRSVPLGATRARVDPPRVTGADLAGATLSSPQADRSASPGVSLDMRVAQLAASQHGVVSRRQLLAIGLSKDEIWHRVRIGRLHRIHAGVYAVGHLLLPRYGLCMAAVLACSGGVLSHGSARRLLGCAACRGAMSR